MLKAVMGAFSAVASTGLPLIDQLIKRYEGHVSDEVLEDAYHFVQDCKDDTGEATLLAGVNEMLGQWHDLGDNDPYRS